MNLRRLVLKLSTSGFLTKSVIQTQNICKNL